MFIYIVRFNDLYCVYVCLQINMGCVCIPGAHEVRRKHQSQRAESPCGCWGLNLGFLQEHHVLLTVEPSLPGKQFLIGVRE